MSSGDDKSDAIKQAEFQLGISDSNAKSLVSVGVNSGGARGKSYEIATPFHVPNEFEKNAMVAAARASAGKREHVTNTIAKDYNSK
ncbi:hypothetical protein MY11210_009426 [Beauveria gryllotalpidicola]